MTTLSVGAAGGADIENRQIISILFIVIIIIEGFNAAQVISIKPYWYNHVSLSVSYVRVIMIDETGLS